MGDNNVDTVEIKVKHSVTHLDIKLPIVNQFSSIFILEFSFIRIFLKIRSIARSA